LGDVHGKGLSTVQQGRQRCRSALSTSMESPSPLRRSLLALPGRG
jgi:hypothetical protein